MCPLSRMYYWWNGWLIFNSCFFVSVPQLKPRVSPTVGWEGSVCNRFPTPVYTVVHTNAAAPATPAAPLRLRGFQQWRRFCCCCCCCCCLLLLFLFLSFFVFVSWRLLELKVIVTWVSTHQAFCFSPPTFQLEAVSYTWPFDSNWNVKLRLNNSRLGLWLVSCIIVSARHGIGWWRHQFLSEDWPL